MAYLRKQSAIVSNITSRSRIVAYTKTSETAWTCKKRQITKRYRKLTQRKETDQRNRGGTDGRTDSIGYMRHMRTAASCTFVYRQRQLDDVMVSDITFLWNILPILAITTATIGNIIVSCSPETLGRKTQKSRVKIGEVKRRWNSPIFDYYKNCTIMANLHLLNSWIELSRRRRCELAIKLYFFKQ